MIEIYGKDNCPYCDMAKGLAERKGFAVVYKELNVDYGFDEMREKISWCKNLPQIIKDGEYIGGYSALEQLIGGL